MRRVIITGSVAAVVNWPAVDPRVYDEASMNETSVQAVKEGSTDPMTIYCAAKTESEKSTCFLQSLVKDDRC